MSIIAVDLAAKFSAAVTLNDDGTVADQWDSWQISQTAFIDEVVYGWSGILAADKPDLLIVEDLPPRVPWMTTVKDVCRIQGRLIERMHRHDALDRLLFVQPDQWRSHFAGLKRGTGPDAVVPVAASLGYEPPDLTDRIGKGEKATARKVATDYCAAYLIGRWALDYHAEHGHLDAPRTTRFHNL